MDMVLAGAGRDITIHLPPSKMPCPSPDCRFNSMYKKYVGVDGAICRDCAGQGFVQEPRQTIYTANIRWINEPLFGTRGQELIVAGRMLPNVVRTKTVSSSIDHIKESVGATIDGIDVELFEEPRPVGFVNVTYTVALWKEVGR